MNNLCLKSPQIRIYIIHALPKPVQAYLWDLEWILGLASYSHVSRAASPLGDCPLVGTGAGRFAFCLVSWQGLVAMRSSSAFVKHALWITGHGGRRVGGRFQGLVSLGSTVSYLGSQRFLKDRITQRHAVGKLRQLCLILLLSNASELLWPTALMTIPSKWSSAGNDLANSDPTPIFCREKPVPSGFGHAPQHCVC